MGYTGVGERKNMFKFAKKIKFFILSLQDKMLSRKLAPHLEKSFSNKDSKIVLSGSETLTLNSETNRKIEHVIQGVSDIAKSGLENPQKLLDYITAKGTEVFRVKNAVKILEKINEHEGLITELHGAKALYLNIFVKKQFSIRTNPMFVIGTGEIKPYYLLREFYLWYALQMGLPGFNNSAQENFKKYFKNPNDPSFKSLNYKAMLELKEAIARDSEANEFVMNIIKEKEGGKNIFNKLNKGGGTV